MKNSGYLIIDRNIESWEFLNKPLAYALWNHLLRLAAWKDTDEIKRGEIIISIRKLSEISGITREVISKWFSEFENAGQIHVEQCGRQLKITLLNYEKYNVKAAGKTATTGRNSDHSEKFVAGKTATTGRNSDHSESNPSLFNRNNEEIKSIKNRNTYTGESVDAELLTDAEIWFSEFWKVYPKHKAKAAAEKAFRKVCTSADEFRRIMAGLNNAISRDWQNIDPRYIPYPATWINGKRWEDEETSQKTRNPYIQSLINEMNGEKNEPEGNENDSGYDPFDVSHYRKQWADG